MAHTDRSIWTCDRCGKVDTFDLGDKPSHWTHVTRQTIYGKGYSAAQNTVRDTHLCRECGSDLDRLLREPPPRHKDDHD